MAYSINDAASAVLKLAEIEGLCIDQKEKANFSETGEGHICGFMCKVVNVLTLKSCRVLVNKSWFDKKWSNFPRPRMKHGINTPEIDFQLIPTGRKLFAIYYLDLRHYALLLEKDRDHWFQQSYWGMQIDEEKESFVWTGGNIITFPLIRINKCLDMQKRPKEILNSLQSNYL